MNKNKFIEMKISAGIWLLAICLFLHAPSAKAQENEGVRFGIKGGINYSTLAVDVDGMDAENGKIGLQGGFFARIPLAGEFLFFQPEVLYSSKGSKITYDPLRNTNFQNGEEVRFNLNYIDVPLMAILKLGPIDIQGGIYASYLLNANVKNLEYTDAVNPTNLATFNSNDFNRIDYGLVGGAALTSNKITIGARYNYGLREIGNTRVIRNVTAGSRNQVLQAFIGYMF